MTIPSLARLRALRDRTNQWARADRKNESRARERGRDYYADLVDARADAYEQMLIELDAVLQEAAAEPAESMCIYCHHRWPTTNGDPAVCGDCHRENQRLRAASSLTLDLRAQQADEWTDVWPSEQGWYWFFGVRSAMRQKPELVPVVVRHGADARPFYIAAGAFLYREEGATGRWLRLPLPSAPKET